MDKSDRATALNALAERAIKGDPRAARQISKLSEADKEPLWRNEIMWDAHDYGYWHRGEAAPQVNPLAVAVVLVIGVPLLCYLAYVWLW